jgi:translation initiation factor IF-2
MAQESSTLVQRPPVIAVMGHIDHGKSSLLDYIRSSATVAGEAGGITQHLSAYEVVHTTSEGGERSITFLDTPGHEAFQKMRTRGSAVADIAILIVSAEDGAKPQTIEAWRAIIEAHTPFVVAFSKIDKPNANLEKAKASLLERGIYLEGMGGDIPYVAISSKTGAGIPELLDVVLLVADLANLTGDTKVSAQGVVIESHTDPKKGMSATMIVKDGILTAGEFIVAGAAWAPTRLMTDFRGNAIKRAKLSQPVTVSGFSTLPVAGTPFFTVSEKREAESAATAARAQLDSLEPSIEDKKKIHIPIIIKADASGSLEAIEHELIKRQAADISIQIVAKSVGTISENDVKFAGGTEKACILGFNVTPDAAALEWSRRLVVALPTFSVIYKMGEWLDAYIAEKRTTLAQTEPTGVATVLKVFSKSSHGQLIGCRVTEGTIVSGQRARMSRNGETIGVGRIETIKNQRDEVATISDHKEFGALIDLKTPIEEGDTLECLQPHHQS